MYLSVQSIIGATDKRQGLKAAVGRVQEVASKGAGMGGIIPARSSIAGQGHTHKTKPTPGKPGVGLKTSAWRAAGCRPAQHQLMCRPPFTANSAPVV